MTGGYFEIIKVNYINFVKFLEKTEFIYFQSKHWGLYHREKDIDK